jgi:tRNA threonylcarbamoyladenosine biosynthesis protein TsaE
MNFVYPLADIDQAADWLLSAIGSARVICFHGEMGAGKTTLIQAICKQLRIRGNVSSPTFPIINEYGLSDGRGAVYHLDLYRLNGLAEAERVGVGEVLDSGARCLVEWPERVPEVLPTDAAHVYLQVIDTEMRSLRVGN